jgi:hypothetical protein
MAKKAPSTRKKLGRTTAKRRASRSGVVAVGILLDRFPPVENCHVTVQGDPPYGKCEDGGGGRCTFPGLKVGREVTQMILCETNGKAQLVLQMPKRRPPQQSK